MITGILEELVKKLIPEDAIEKIIAAVKNKNDSKIGAELFEVYHGFVMVHTHAIEIVSGLRFLHDLVSRNSKYNYSRSNVVHQLTSSIERQIYRVTDLLRNFENLSRSINILSPQGFRVMEAFLSPKADLLRLLMKAIELSRQNGDSAIFTITDSDFVHYLENISNGDRRAPSMLRALASREIKQITDKRSESTEFTNHGIDLPSVLTAYFAGRSPEIQLDAVGKALDVFYQAITSQFTIRELLPRVHRTEKWDRNRPSQSDKI
ncbi:hypothetical protein [Falsiroseomonas sp. HW251]|uniref:hypothetical protein n=1 Tax=Falsiroseomonas sp. HW251 TaxID=3390998 RepID=UPI003D3130EF